MMKRHFIRIAGLLGTLTLLLLPLSCAKSPPGVSTSGPQLILTMTMAGPIDPVNDHYFILFNNTNDSTGSNGPVPVVSAPWGNGFATGRTGTTGLTQFVRFDAVQNSVQGGGFGVYTVVPGSDLRSFQYLGVPTQTSVTNNTLQFQIPLSYLATTAVPAGSTNYIQINFLATDSIPIDTNNNEQLTKEFDALGTSDSGDINEYITISTTKSGIYRNADKGIEPSDDVSQAGGGNFAHVSNPPIDITDWSVQVLD